MAGTLFCLAAHMARCLTAADQGQEAPADRPPTVRAPCWAAAWRAPSSWRAAACAARQLAPPWRAAACAARQLAPPRRAAAGPARQLAPPWRAAAIAWPASATKVNVDCCKTASCCLRCSAHLPPGPHITRAPPAQQRTQHAASQPADAWHAPPSSTAHPSSATCTQPRAPQLPPATALPFPPPSKPPAPQVR
jgi:hypothetical protein